MRFSFSPPSLKWSALKQWIDYRLPVFSFVENHLARYKTPPNLNVMWNFGSLAGITLVIMIASGLFLAMHYVPHVDHAFDSVERIMRDVNHGWLIRYIHMNGASMFFVVVYLHVFRGFYYRSWQSPRELLWMLGVVVFVIMMATAFMGYVLPWGQMSYWGATVITSLFSALPFVGESIVTWLWGGFGVDQPTLNRFFVLHYLFPFLLVGVVGLHLVALHQHGSSNPEGKTFQDHQKIPFHPWYTVKDLTGLGVFLLVFFGFVFFAPDFFSEPDNAIPANPLVTPPHIVPEWYFLPFYAILRSVPSKLGGVILMFGALALWMVVPWLDQSRKPRDTPPEPLWIMACGGLGLCCLVLGWVGAQAPEGWPLWAGRIATLWYYLHFLVFIPAFTLKLPKGTSA